MSTISLTAMQTQRVVFIIDSLFMGGTERHFLSLVDALREVAEVETHLIIVNPGGPLDQQAIESVDKHLAVNRQTEPWFKLPFRLMGELRKLKPTVLHTYGWMSNVIGLVSGLPLGIPVINGSIRNVTPEIWHHRICQICAYGSALVVANAQAGLDAYGLSGRKKSRVVHNGIELARFDAVQPHLDYSNGGYAICMVANFSDKKDHATVIRAFAALHQTHDEARLILIGRDAGLLDSNQQLATALEIGASVEFITDCNQPEPYIAASDVCILTSPKGEGISNSLLEYMALGRPVIATDCGGNREVIVHDESGFLVPLDSEEAMIEKLTLLYENEALREEMGRKARERVEEKFSLPAMIDQYRQLYASLLPQHSSNDRYTAHGLEVKVITEKKAGDFSAPKSDCSL